MDEIQNSVTKYVSEMEAWEVLRRYRVSLKFVFDLLKFQVLFRLLIYSVREESIFLFACLFSFSFCSLSLF